MELIGQMRQMRQKQTFVLNGTNEFCPIFK
nr:MAG TPA_asm: hypothetical protein [Caudoviricetes sp.]